MNSAQRSSTDDAWLTAGRFALLLGLMVFVTFPEVVLGTRTFVFRDYGLFSYPVAFFQKECFWRDEMPLWNPYSLCGVPFLAQWNTICLYPPALLYLLLPLTWALSFFCLVHLFWGGLGMYLLARYWTGNILAGALAGVIFSFNGLSLNFLMWPSHIATFSWLPWVLWLVPRGWREGGRKLLWATGAGALQMLAGAPETILFTWIILGLLACGDWFTVPAPGQTSLPRKDEDVFARDINPQAHMSPAPGLRRQLLARLAGMLVLITLICSAQLLPFFNLLAHSQRDTGYGSRGWSMPAWGLANFLVPLFKAYQTPGGVYMQPGQYWTSSYYAGIGTVLLVAVAVWSVRNWRVRLLGVMMFLALILALGNAGLLYAAFRHCVPGLGIARYPVKFVILVLALAPLLAAVGLQALTAEPARARRSVWFCAVGILLVIALIVVSQWRMPPSVKWTTFRNGITRAGVLALVSWLLARFAKKDPRLRGSWPRLLGVLLLVAFWLDFLTHVPPQNPTASPSIYEPRALSGQRHWKPKPVLGQSRAMLSPEAQQDLKYNSLTNIETTYLLDRLGLLANCNLLEDVPQAHGFFSLAPAGANDVCSLWYVRTNQDFSRLLDFMGVSQVSAPGHTFDWSPRQSAMPLVTAGQEPVFADDGTVFAMFSNTNSDFLRSVFLPSEARSEVSAERQPDAQVKTAVFSGKEIRIQMDCRGPCMVVVAQTWFPAWRAYVDGEPTKLWRANYAFQAVQVPAGNHVILIKYLDRFFLAGTALSALGLSACVPLWFRSRRPGEHRDLACTAS